MSDDEREANMTEPPSVEIPLDDRLSDKARHSSGSSSASTSSFEDLNTLRLVNATRRESAQSYHSENSVRSEGAVVVSVVTPRKESKTSDIVHSSPTGMLSFKKTSVEESPPGIQTPLASPSSPQDISTNINKHAASPNPNPKPARTKTQAKQKGKAKPKGKYFAQNRDPEDVNAIVKIDFEDIFAEPEGTYSFGTIWGATQKIFTDTKLWCYKFLSALCGVPCALCWGLHFACLSFCMIWSCQPSIRSFSIQVKPLSRVYGVIVNSFIEPCFVAFGRMFSSIRVHLAKD